MGDKYEKMKWELFFEIDRTAIEYLSAVDVDQKYNDIYSRMMVNYKKEQLDSLVRIMEKSSLTDELLSFFSYSHSRAERFKEVGIIH